MQCYYNTQRCEGKLWKCQTCGEHFCKTHWNKSSLGTCVECQACEQTRLKEVEKSLEPVAKLIVHLEGGLIRFLLSDKLLDIYILDEDPGMIDDSDCDEIELFENKPTKYYITTSGSDKIDPIGIEKVIEQIKATGD